MAQRCHLIVGFHPVFDNPIRMGYVAGWTRVEDLLEKLSDLEHAIGESRVVPARWEPYYDVCRRCRYASAYAWAGSELQDPVSFARALGLYPGEEENLATRIGHANFLILSTGSEASAVTRKLMLAEAFGLWEQYGVEWAEKVVQQCAGLGISVTVHTVCEQVQLALEPLAKVVEAVAFADHEFPSGSTLSHGFEKELLAMDGWTPDPGIIILPVDARTHALGRRILRLDLSKVVLLKAGKTERAVPWEKVTAVHLWDGVVTFEITDEPALSVPGYKDPSHVLNIIQGCYKAATERMLQSVAKHVLRVTP